MIFKTTEEESWSFSIPDNILAEYTLVIPLGGNPLEDILELTANSLVINDLSNPELKPGMHYVDLLYTDVSGEQRT